MEMKRLVTFALIIAALGILPATGGAESEVSLLPWPKSIRLGQGDMEVTESSRIIALDEEFEPLAELLAEEIHLVTGLRLKAGPGQPGRGDIVLRKDKGLKKEEYTLQVKDRTVVRGGDYRGAAWGTATLLQLVSVEDGRSRLPSVEIHDYPDSEYRGVMSDVARNWVSPEIVQCVIGEILPFAIPKRHAG